MDDKQEEKEDDATELCEKIFNLMDGYSGGAQATSLSLICASMISSQENINESYFKFTGKIKNILHKMKEIEDE
jgi:hypothetical protein